MSDRGEPTLGDVIAAVSALGTAVPALASKQTADMQDLRAKMTDMRKVLMGRMDRLQDTMTKQRDDISLRLDLVVDNKSRTEIAVTEARAARIQTAARRRH